MSEPRDPDRLLGDHLEGKLGEAETRELATLLEQSDRLKEQLALATLVDRLLRASSLPPVTGASVVKALRNRGMVQPAARRTSVSGLVAALVVLGILITGGIALWRTGMIARPARDSWRDPSPARPPSLAGSGSIGTGLVHGVATGAVVQGDVPEGDTPQAVRAVEDEVKELPLSAFQDEAPLPPGDGSDEPGFVPPPPARDPGLGKTGAGRDEGVLAAGTLVPTRPREMPKTPLLFVRLRLGESRDGRPDDLDWFLGILKARAGLSYRIEVRTPDEVERDAERNPVLYVSGHYRFSFTPAQRKLFRQYMLAGGTMVFDAGLGSKPFYESARHELGIIFRDYPLARLTARHPVYWAYYESPRGRSGGVAPGDGVMPLEGVTVRCRTVALVSPGGVVAGSRSEEAIRMGVNLASYIVAWRGWVKRGALPGLMVKDPVQGMFERLRLGQVMHQGDWNPRPLALPMLLQTFSRRTSVPVQPTIREVRLTDSALFDYPFLYLVGHGEFHLTDGERQALRRYLENGGFILAEACCGERGFDRAFRTQIRLTLPESVLTPVPGTSGLFSVPNAIKGMSVTPLLAGQLGRAVIEPRLEGVELQGRYVVVYSPYGLAGCWELSQNPYALGYNDSEAIRLGQNILMYAVTH